MRSLVGRKVLVTGAGTRIGQAIAIALARDGCDVIVHYCTNRAGAEETAGKIKSYGRQAVCFSADFRQFESIKDLVDKSVQVFGGLDALVNSASVFPLAGRRDGESDLSHETIESWNLSLDVNARAPFFLIQHASPFLKKSTDGCVINILDTSVSDPFVSRASHSVSKGALASITRLAAKTFYPKVRVNGLELGHILPSPDMSAEEIAQQKWGGVSNVAEAVIFLLKNGFMTGEILRMCGGKLLLGDRTATVSAQ